jgi:hypothetical protein
MDYCNGTARQSEVDALYALASTTEVCAIKPRKVCNNLSEAHLANVSTRACRCSHGRPKLKYGEVSVCARTRLYLRCASKMRVYHLSEGQLTKISTRSCRCSMAALSRSGCRSHRSSMREPICAAPPTSATSAPPAAAAAAANVKAAAALSPRVAPAARAGPSAVRSERFRRRRRQQRRVPRGRKHDVV